MQKIRIDFDNPGLPQHISAVENDSQSRFFQATLYENGKAYTAPEGATYSIMYRGFGPQNQGWYDTINDGAGKRAACAVSGNVVTCEIARQALQAPGHVSIVLCVTTGNGYMLKSWPIECDCKNDRYDSTAEIQSFFYITQVSNADWTQAIQAWENLKDTIDPTLSVSGKAADAAKVGDKFNLTVAYQATAEGSIDDILSNGIYYIGAKNANMPFAESGIIVVMGNNSTFGMQMAIEFNSAKTYLRTKAGGITWREWVELDSINYPFPVAYRDTASDPINGILSNGIYYVNKNTTDMPFDNAGLLIVMGNNSTFGMQMASDFETAKTYVRTKVGGATWRSWQLLNSTVNDRWSNANANFLGDSIVEGKAGNFVNVVSRYLSLGTVRNYGIGGSRMASSDRDSEYTPVCKLYSTISTDADIIYVAAGTNDYSGQIPLGESDSTDITTFNGALNVTMQGLRSMFPTKLIIFANILSRYTDSNDTKVIKCDEYRKCIEERCYENHIVFYDSYKYSGFDFSGGANELTADGLHPNQIGAEILGRKISGFMNWQ